MTENLTPTEIEDIYRLHLMVRQANDINHKCSEDELKKCSITPEQASALISIHSLGKEATPANVSRWLTREPHSILIILRRMRKMGLIEMEPHQKNKHMFRISLTKTGREAYLNAIKLSSVVDIFSILPREERQYLFYLLKKIRNESLRLMNLDVRYCDKLGETFKLPVIEGKKVKRSLKESKK